MKKYDIVIGIDPDTVKSGVAFLEVATRKLEASALPFPQLIDYLKYVSDTNKVEQKSVVVVVEAGWLNTISNYHTKADRKGQRIAKNVGANHETGKKIVEMCRHFGLETVEQKPLIKIWKGKISMTELNQLLMSKKMGTLDKKVNQDCRDAVLLTLYISGIL
jgi:hypothetical protein